jgi:hypothetical protein
MGSRLLRDRLGRLLPVFDATTFQIPLFFDSALAGHGVVLDRLAGSTSGRRSICRPRRPSRPSRFRSTASGGNPSRIRPSMHWLQRPCCTTRILPRRAANVAEAKAAVATAKSLLSPRVDGVINASSSQRQFTLGKSEKEFDDVVSAGAIGAAINWEIDLWDRIRQMNDAALARFAATEHARNATTLSISTLVADTWFQLRVLDAKLLVTRAASVNLKSVSDLEFRRWKAEVGTEMAYIQSLAEFKATEARLPAFEEAIYRTELALKLLVGRSPRAIGGPVPRPSLQKRMGEDLPEGSMPIVPQTPREGRFDPAAAPPGCGIGRTVAGCRACRRQQRARRVLSAPDAFAAGRLRRLDLQRDFRYAAVLGSGRRPGRADLRRRPGAVESRCRRGTAAEGARTLPIHGFAGLPRRLPVAGSAGCE